MLNRLQSIIPRRAPGETIITALDVGTEFVKAILARVNGETLEIIGIGRARQGVGDMHGGAVADIAGVVKNCEAALAEAEEQAGVQAKEVVMGIAGELVKGSTNTVRYRRPQPDKPLDEAEMRFIIQKVQERAYDRAQKQISFESGNAAVEIKLVNSALVGITIDSHPISNPVGFTGRDVVIQMYTAFAPMVYINALERVAGELDLELLAVAAEPFAVSRSVVGTDAGSNFTAILIDVGGGTTDIAVVNDGGVEGTKMFGIGGRAFTRTIMSELDLNYTEAEKLKVNLENTSLPTKATQAASEAVDKTLAVWIGGVELALEEFDALDHLPSRILLCGGGSSLGQLVELLETHKWSEELPFTRRPSVHHITLDEVEGVKDQTGSELDHTFITAIGLLRVGYDTMQGAEPTGIKEAINRMMRI